MIWYQNFIASTLTTQSILWSLISFPNVVPRLILNYLFKNTKNVALYARWVKACGLRWKWSSLFMNGVVLGLYLESSELGCCYGDDRLQNVYFIQIFKIMYIDTQPAANKTLWFYVVYCKSPKYSSATNWNSMSMSVLLAVAPLFLMIWGFCRKIQKSYIILG